MTISFNLKNNIMEPIVEQIMVMPRIGDKAPEFNAITTQGDIHFPSDYSGKWVIIFSY